MISWAESRSQPNFLKKMYEARLTPQSSINVLHQASFQPDVDPRAPLPGYVNPKYVKKAVFFIFFAFGHSFGWFHARSHSLKARSLSCGTNYAQNYGKRFL